MKKLSAKFVREVTAPGRYYDGDAGLFLLAKPSGRKSYLQRLTIHGKRHDIGLGSIRWTTLTEARAAAQANRKIARTGGDPLAAKRAGVPTFDIAADIVVGIHRESWKDSGKSEAQWRASLRDYALPRLGRKRVDQITAADVMGVLLPHWQSKRETMRRVRQRISAVMRWAIAQGYRNDDPAGDAIGAVLPRNNHTVTHQKSLPYSEVGAAIDKVKASGANRVTVLAFEFLVLTACRSGEVRLATWDEIDLDSATWEIAASRMKAKRAHRVPLAPRALEILTEAKKLSGDSGLVFPGRRGTALSESTFARLLRGLRVDAVPHGFRSSFRDWCAECSDAPREVCELALAHINSDRVESAYMRSDLFERRRALMQAWADFLSA